MEREMRLSGKTFIVTGGARGIGREYVLGLVRNGASVVIGDISDCAETEELALAAGGQVLSVPLDVTDGDSAYAMAVRAIERFGRIDGLVNNAAFYANLKGGKFDQIDEREWNLAMKVNVTGIWNCCKAVVPYLKVTGGGSIVNITSLAATFGTPYVLHYTTSKAAVIGITKGLARELGRDGIRVNAIAPSAVLTEATKGFFGAKADDALEFVRKSQAIQRNLDPTDLVGTCLWLLSDDSSFVTGQTISVDGGTVMH
jgi:3-oxoacyl-[acyl-carrier protein] reductase